MEKSFVDKQYTPENVTSLIEYALLFYNKSISRDRNILLHEKALLHAINSHVLTGTCSSINQAINELLIHGVSPKCDVTSSNVHRSEHNLVASSRDA